jgi:hypothetical protein
MVIRIKQNSRKGQLKVQNNVPYLYAKGKITLLLLNFFNLRFIFEGGYFLSTRTSAKMDEVIYNCI